MTAVVPGSSFTVSFHFSADLQFFLPKADPAQPLQRLLREKTSVKDAIEACGVPHPEVNLIRCDGERVGFEHQLNRAATIDVAGLESWRADGLQQRRLTQFVLDGHLGKLARDLRLLGFDALYTATTTDAELVAISARQERALLTRDRRLLMHSVVRHGYCPRSDDPDRQIVEVLARFDLHELMQPYTRCMHCNGLLHAAAKDEVLHELEPLTRIYYDEFRRCAGCRRVYWAGSHFAKLAARIEKIRSAFSGGAP